MDAKETAIELHSIFADNGSSSSENVEYPASQCDDDEIYELPPLSCSVTRSEILFNGIVCMLTALNLVTDLTLVCYHYNTGNSWACALTCVCLAFGGVAILRTFWGVTYDNLGRIYGSSDVIRVLFNSFPWVITIVTSYQATTCCYKSTRTPMATQRYVNLANLSVSFLRVQGLAQHAPNSVLQLVVFLESLRVGSDGNMDINGIKATLLLTSVATCVTLIMVSNLPLKSDQPVNSTEPPSKSAYSARSRIYVGARMLSSFVSRTLSLSVLFSSSRCLGFHLSPSSVLPHAIPFLFLTLSRLVFTLADFAYSRLSKEAQRYKLCDLLTGYVATIFMPMYPAWIFWYVSAETVAFMVLGMAAEGITAGCYGSWGVVVAINLVFLFNAVVVPCVLPVLVRKRTERSRAHH